MDKNVKYTYDIKDRNVKYLHIKYQSETEVKIVEINCPPLIKKILEISYEK